MGFCWPHQKIKEAMRHGAQVGRWRPRNGLLEHGMCVKEAWDVGWEVLGEFDVFFFFWGGGVYWFFLKDVPDRM